MAEQTRASRPPGKSSGSGGKIMGLDRTTFFIVLAGAVVVGYIYFRSKSSSQSSSGSGSGQKSGARKANYSPTGLTREHIVIWQRGHSGHKHHG